MRAHLLRKESLDSEELKAWPAAQGRDAENLILVSTLVTLALALLRYDWLLEACQPARVIAALQRRPRLREPLDRLQAEVLNL